jgi:hypothetical protein
MTLFGKLMLVFNLLAAGGFVYLATQDWKGRQNINAFGLRNLLLVQGLPLDGPTSFSGDDETPFRVDGPGGVPTKTISKKVLDGYFQAAPGQPAAGGDAAAATFLGTNAAVPNQIAEVRRVKSKVEEILNKAGSPQEKVRLLTDWLIYQVETYDERLEIMALAATEKVDTTEAKPRVRAKNEEEIKKDADELQKRLFTRFDSVINWPTTASALSTDPLPELARVTGELNKLKDDLDKLKAAKADKSELDAKERLIDDKQKEVDAALEQIRARNKQLADSRAIPLDESERQMKLVHLLVHLNTDAAWQKRVMMVVGLRNYVPALTAQAVRFADMARQVEKLISTDQSGFLDKVASQAMLSRDGTELVNHQASVTAKLVAQATKEADFLAQRQTQFTDIKNQLTKIKGEVETMLAKQTNVENGLFEIQREVAITLDEVYRLEAVLAARERELFRPLPTDRK